jgi:outer membrane protein, multidrug efflux system
MPPSSRFRSAPLRSAAALAVLLLSVSGCALSPVPLTDAENTDRVRLDLRAILAPQEPVAAPISMHEAMARALKYNLDERVKLMEMAVANQQLDLSRFDMLPRVVTSAGYTGRNNESGSESLNLNSRTRTPTSSTSTDRYRQTADFGLTWNILDFGVSYFRARQNANLVLVSDERRRRVVQGILQDVRTSYWRAVAAERLLKRIEPLEKRAEKARTNAAALESQRVQAPLESLTYQRTLVDTLRQLQGLRRELAVAKSQLGALMGLTPGQVFQVAIPPEVKRADAPAIKADPDRLESYALLNRPELREESYNARISVDETRRSLVKMLPGIDANAAFHFDSNSFLVNQRWADYGARVSWNLLSLASLPDLLAFNDAQENLVDQRRQALSVAVLSQVRVALAQFAELKREFDLTVDQADIERRIERLYRNAGAAGQQGELGVIQAEATTVVSDLRRDLVYADLQNAYARVMVSAGIDPLPDAIPANDLATVRKAVEQGMTDWEVRAASTAKLGDLAAPPASETK